MRNILVALYNDLTEYNDYTTMDKLKNLFKHKKKDPVNLGLVDNKHMINGELIDDIFVVESIDSSNNIRIRNSDTGTIKEINIEGNIYDNLNKEKIRKMFKDDVLLDNIKIISD